MPNSNEEKEHSKCEQDLIVVASHDSFEERSANCPEASFPATQSSNFSQTSNECSTMEIDKGFSKTASFLLSMDSSTMGGYEVDSEESWYSSASETSEEDESDDDSLSQQYSSVLSKDGKEAIVDQKCSMDNFGLMRFICFQTEGAQRGILNSDSVQDDDIIYFQQSLQEDGTLVKDDITLVKPRKKLSKNKKELTTVQVKTEHELLQKTRTAEDTVSKTNNGESLKERSHESMKIVNLKEKADTFAPVSSLSSNSTTTGRSSETREEDGMNNTSNDETVEIIEKSRSGKASSHTDDDEAVLPLEIPGESIEKTEGMHALSNEEPVESTQENVSGKASDTDKQAAASSEKITEEKAPDDLQPVEMTQEDVAARAEDSMLVVSQQSDLLLSFLPTLKESTLAEMFFSVFGETQSPSTPSQAIMETSPTELRPGDRADESSFEKPANTNETDSNVVVRTMTVKVSRKDFIQCQKNKHVNSNASQSIENSSSSNKTNDGDTMTESEPSIAGNELSSKEDDIQTHLETHCDLSSASSSSFIVKPCNPIDAYHKRDNPFEDAEDAILEDSFLFTVERGPVMSNSPPQPTNENSKLQKVISISSLEAFMQDASMDSSTDDLMQRNSIQEILEVDSVDDPTIAGLASSTFGTNSENSSTQELDHYNIETQAPKSAAIQPQEQPLSQSSTNFHNTRNRRAVRLQSIKVGRGCKLPPSQNKPVSSGQGAELFCTTEENRESLEIDQVKIPKENSNIRVLRKSKALRIQQQYMRWKAAARDQVVES